MRRIVDPEEPPREIGQESHWIFGEPGGRADEELGAPEVLEKPMQRPAVLAENNVLVCDGGVSARRLEGHIPELLVERPIDVPLLISQHDEACQ